MSLIMLEMLMLGFFSEAALAHPGEPLAPGDAWRTWSLEAPLLFALISAATLYLAGCFRLGARGISASTAGWLWRMVAYYAGLIAVFIALVSPVDTLGALLFSAHMVQHLVLIVVAAPLLVVGLPVVPMLAAPPVRLRRCLTRGYRRQGALRIAWSWLTHPVVVLGLNVAVLWTWHIPAFYQAALRNEAIHLVEHVSFLASAMLFWWTVIQPIGRRRLGLGIGVPYVFVAGMSMALLGALLTVSPTILYPAYGETAEFGLTPLEDQQLAGLIMWVPSAPVYLITALLLLAALLRHAEADHSQPRSLTDAEPTD